MEPKPRDGLDWIAEIDPVGTPFTALFQAKRFGPEPVGHEPSKHPIRGRLWRRADDAFRRVERGCFALDCWLTLRGEWFAQHARAHDPKPIYAPGAWEPYRTVTFGDFTRPNIDPDVIGVDTDGNDVRRSDVEDDHVPDET